jgi:hypothetical protein
MKHQKPTTKAAGIPLYLLGTTSRASRLWSASRHIENATVLEPDDQSSICFPQKGNRPHEAAPQAMGMQRFGGMQQQMPMGMQRMHPRLKQSPTAATFDADERHAANNQRKGRRSGQGND